MDAQPLTLADTVRYHMSTAENPMEIGVLLRLADRMAPHTLEAFVTERLLRHARFRHTVRKPGWLALRPRWQAERGRDLSAHVTAMRAEPGLSEQALAHLVSDRLSQRLDFARSPWHLELLPLSDGSSALLLRVQHCLADGRALVRLLSELADLPVAPPKTPEPARSRGRRRLARHMKPAQLAREARALGAALWHVLSMRDERASPLHAALSGKKLVAWSQALDLPRLTRTAAACGCHVTDLLLSAAAGAVADGLRHAGGAVPDYVRALVPFAMAQGPGELGNHYASVFVDLPTYRMAARLRVERVAAATRQLRDRSETRLTLALTGLSGVLAPSLMRALVDRFSRKASLVLSNVPGPSQRVALMGHEVRSIIVFAPPSGNMALSFTLFGYAGELRLGVQIDAAARLPPQRFSAGFERALRELEAGQPAAVPTHVSAHLPTRDKHA
ncbi:MAG TPA: WS/DGAT domain-containing protein [Polyangiales bacterium]